MNRLLSALLLLAFGLVVAACSKPKVDEEKTADLIQPVARVEIAEPVAASSGPKSGEDIVKSICIACHGPSGIPQAPKIGDKAAWAPRIAQGIETLYHSALNGKNNIMPPRGGQPALTDDEVKSAVDYLVKQAK